MAEMVAGLSGFYLGLAVLEVVVAVTVCLLAGRLSTRMLQPSRRDVVVFGILLTLILTVEYWAFGPFSFVQVNDEGELTLPLFKYVTRVFRGGLYAHEVAGGNDILAMVAYGNGELSLERALFAVLPSWAALGANKIMAVAVAFSGAYVLARRAAGADRFTALALGVFHAVAHRYMLGATLFQGIGIQLAPWAVYLLVTRLDRRWYVAGAVALSVLHAISSAALHFAPALGFAVLLVWLSAGLPRPLRFLAAMGVLVAAAALNWIEVVFAVVQTAPFSSLTMRPMGGGAEGLAGNLLKYFKDRSPQTLVLALVALGWLIACGRSRQGLRAAVVLVAAWATGPLLLAVPWTRYGLGVLQGYDWFYISLALPTVLVLVGGWAARAVGPLHKLRPALRFATPAIAFLALGSAEIAWTKTYNAAQWLGFGGQTITSRYGNLAQPEWKPDHPFRVVSVPYRLDPDTVSAYGLESFDGFVTNHTAGRSMFWRHAVCGDRPGCPWVLQTYVTTHDITDFLCCRDYPVERVVHDLDALKVGNTEFILSVLPITGLEQVSGPTDDSMPPRRGVGALARASGLARLLVHPGDVRVYRIPGAVPRAFVAAGIDPVAPGAVEAERAAQAVRSALGHRLAMTADSARDMPAAKPGAVRSVEAVRDGYVVAVDMPEGGVLTVNAAWTPYWRAEADGKPVAMAEANLIHTAVAVPPGTRSVTLMYRRPLLRDLMAARLGL